MFNLDLKKAETAINAGRLDEAFTVLTSTPRRFHADGQRIIDRLVAELLKRGNAHYQQQRLAEARSDAALAKQLGGPQIEIVSLLQQVDVRDQSIRRKSIADSQDQVIARLNMLVQQQQFESAMASLAELPQSTRELPEIQRLSSKVSRAVRSQITADLEGGRLERAGEALKMLRQVGFLDDEVNQLNAIVQRFDKIVGDVRDANYFEAARKLKLQQQVIPAADWIGVAIEAMESCSASVEQIFSGPLGFVLPETRSGKQKSMVPIAKRDGFANTQSLGNEARKSHAWTSSDSLFHQTLLHVDQIGSLLVLTGPRIFIGSTSTSRSGQQSDVVLQTEGGHRVEIIRSGSDYIAQCRSNFIVSNKSSNQHLLSNGDTIEIGKRGRLKFLQSVAASDSAVLKVTGSKMKQRQIRSIVLLGESLVFGPSSGHFRLSNLKNRIILRRQKQEGCFLIQQQGSADFVALTPDKAANIDGCRITSERNVSS